MSIDFCNILCYYPDPTSQPHLLEAQKLDGKSVDEADESQKQNDDKVVNPKGEKEPTKMSTTECTDTTYASTESQEQLSSDAFSSTTAEHCPVPGVDVDVGELQNHHPLEYPDIDARNRMSFPRCPTTSPEKTSTTFEFVVNPSNQLDDEIVYLPIPGTNLLQPVKRSTLVLSGMNHNMVAVTVPEGIRPGDSIMLAVPQTLSAACYQPVSPEGLLEKPGSPRDNGCTEKIIPNEDDLVLLDEVSSQGSINLQKSMQSNNRQNYNSSGPLLVRGVAAEDDFSLCSSVSGKNSRVRGLHKKIRRSRTVATIVAGIDVVPEDAILEESSTYISDYQNGVFQDDDNNDDDNYGYIEESATCRTPVVFALPETPYEVEEEPDFAPAVAIPSSDDLVLVTVPSTASPGTRLEIQVHDGRWVEAIVPQCPEGVNEFYVRVPPPRVLDEPPRPRAISVSSSMH